MSRHFSCLILILFVVWILPLGAFIDPAKEKLACDGQRAICLCHHRLIKQQDSRSGKLLIKIPAGTEKENSPGSLSPDFLLAQLKKIFSKENIFGFEQAHTQYSLLIIRSIEHVPKV